VNAFVAAEFSTGGTAGWRTGHRHALSASCVVLWRHVLCIEESPIQRNLAEIRIAIQLQRRFSDRDVTIRRV
jgi:hypothetical protein